jgi:hypothetical protein
MDGEAAELLVLRARMYSDEGTLLGALAPVPRTFLEGLAALLVRAS